MRVLLVFPRFRYPSGDPPLGVAYLAAILRRAGHEVLIADTTFVRRPMRHLRFLMEQWEPELIGISAMTSMIANVRSVARLAKQMRRPPLVVVGGPHATVMPEETLTDERVDLVCVGEGEQTLLELAEQDGQPEGVAGLWYRREGQVVRNEARPPAANLDSLPFPAWDLLDMDRYIELWFQLDAVRYGLRGTSAMASRGCPYHCSYCQPTLERLFGRRIRHRCPESIVAELRELKGRYRIDGVMWLDDTFLLNREWVRKACAALVDAELGLIWGCNVRADRCDRDTLAVMQEAGLRIVHLGIESGSQRVLDEIYHKGITLEQVREAVATAKGLGLMVRGYFMLGAPTETETEVRATIRLANELPLDDVSFSITTPLPHTDLYENTKHLIVQDLSQFDYYRAPVYGGDSVLPAKKLDRLKKGAYLKFYVGRKRFWRTARSVMGLSGLKKALLKLQRF